MIKINQCRQILNNFFVLLRLVDLEYKGNKVIFNEILIRIMSTEKEIFDYDKRYQLIQTVKAKEPRIEYIGKMISMFLNLFELRINGAAVKVDGFRLKNLSDWLIYNNDEPNNILQYISSDCNANCCFCFQKGNPPLLKEAQKKHCSIFEIKTRLKYYSAKRKTALFNQSWMEIDELLTHPYAIDILKKARVKTSNVLQIITNGLSLTENMIKELKQLEPIRISVSLNSANVDIRHRLMNDVNTKVAINSLILLKQYKINYIVTITMWPTISFEDLYDTLKYIQKNDAYSVKIFLPGYSKYISRKPLFNHHNYWGEIVCFIKKVRHEFDMPVLCVPELYEDWYFKNYNQKNLIQGIIKNSPAALSGLKLNDEILKINGVDMSTRKQTVAFLNSSAQILKKVNIMVKRDEEVKSFLLDEQYSNNKYPYFINSWAPFGINVGFGLDDKTINVIEDIIDKHNAKNVLIMSSYILEPFLKVMMKKRGKSNKQVQILIPENNFFGGNIIVGSMLTVDDYIDCLKNWIKLNGKPELILIPSTPFGSRGSGWYRDILGKSYRYIERNIQVKVKLIPFDYYIPY